MRTNIGVFGEPFLMTARRLLIAAALTGWSSVTAQSPQPAGANVATDPDVLGAERLFSAWMEGQITYRGLPGIVVGVVSDQQTVLRHEADVL